jgi:hypothetical protein
MVNTIDTRPRKPCADSRLFADSFGQWAENFKATTRNFDSCGIPEAGFSKYLDWINEIQAGPVLGKSGAVHASSTARKIVLRRGYSQSINVDVCGLKSNSPFKSLRAIACDARALVPSYVIGIFIFFAQFLSAVTEQSQHPCDNACGMAMTNL